MLIHKPHRGIIENWLRVDLADVRNNSMELGYVIAGEHGNSYIHQGHVWQTSWIVSHDVENSEVETLNSRYSLGEPCDPDVARIITNIIRLGLGNKTLMRVN